MATKPGVSNTQPGSILLVVHDFVARSADELSLAKGDRIELIERDDEFGDGWYLGKHLANAKSGLFPAVYTAPAPKATLANANKVTRVGGNVPKAGQAMPATAAAGQQNLPATPASTRSSSSSQSPLAHTALRSSVSSATSSGRNFAVSNDSPVMNETLSVINEHITDMRGPRAPFGHGNKRDTITSIYSTQPLSDRAYIAGHETDEEEQQQQQEYTEEQVMTWNPDRVAEYLEDHGVEPAHCGVFKEQDISGEVFLAMDQNSLFIKEFELGSVGRRLKTWHRIKALQDEIRHTRHADPARNASNHSLGGDDTVAGEAPSNRHRSSTVGSTLPRALTTAGKSSSRAEARSRASLAVSPLHNVAPAAREDSTLRPSAQDIRNLNHSRRHSSIASIESLATDPGRAATVKKQAPAESRWQPSQTILNGKGTHGYTTSMDSQFPNLRHGSMPASPGEVERGYFSSTEVDDRHRRRHLLSKRNSTAASPGHSRNNSSLANNRASIITASTASTRDPMSPLISPGTQPTTQSSRFSAFRSATTPPQTKVAASPRSTGAPLVTKLDPEKSATVDNTTISTTSEKEGSGAAAHTSSPSSFGMSLFASARAKVSGFRSTSEAVTKEEKSLERSPTMIRDRPLGSPTRASTPSTENQSLELSKSDLVSRASTSSATNLIPLPTKRRPRAKSKKSTSAYTKGLEKKTPAEQMLTCDYSGWMKKKRGSLMTTWKPRLFVLRGRRLSYYYSDQDTEEKGLIDISFHRVLPATNEMLPALHATVTGAASPTSPETQHAANATPTIAEQDLRNYPPAASEAADDAGLFIFKLVPPKSGLAKGVNFTKPTVHYFAVNSRQEGRLWMAALMKATIERDGDGVVTTTYNQKTISLAKARARKERPPALRDEDTVGLDSDAQADAGAEADADESTVLVVDPSADEKGLGIGGLDAAAADDIVTKVDDDATPLAEKDVNDGSQRSSVVTAVSHQDDRASESQS